MIALEKKNINLLIDFDSTFIKLETLEEIAKISLKDNPSKNKTLNQIITLTQRAMDGEISFSNALEKRIQLLQTNNTHIKSTIKLLRNNISKSFIDNKDFIKTIAKRIYIISGGFKEVIYPIVKNFNIKYSNIYANDFLYEKNKIISIDKLNPLA